MNRNASILGLILGIIMPVIGLLIIFLFRGGSFSDYQDLIFSNHRIVPTLLSLALLLNLIPFLYYNSKRLDMTVRGIFVATMLYAVLIVLLKFVW
jgi:hypothetical protein